MLKRLLNPSAIPITEQRNALLAGKNIIYTLKRSSKRKSIGLRIDGCGLTVSVPQQASEKWLHSVLQDKAGWVMEKLNDWQMKKPLETRWEDGEPIPFLGEMLILRLVPGRAPVVRRDDELLIGCAGSAAQRHVAKWYRHQAEQLFAARVAHYGAMLGVAPTAIRLSSAKKQWGCCTARGTVRLNKQLIKLPLYLIDYVVVHELAHLIELNHSAAFWKVVGSVCPDYAKLRRELKAIAL